MRILHTADWHLADRLKQIDRTSDLERAVEHIAGYCEQESVDTLLIAGDLFSELARPDALQSSLAHLTHVFRPFLLRDGTIVAIAGNHDNDIFCETLRRAFQLAAPTLARCGDTLSPGRFYIITRPAHFCLCDERGRLVQFACMPYPTEHRYLHGLSANSYSSFDERCRLLRTTFLQRLMAIRSQLDDRLPRILIAHANTIRPRATTLFRSRLDDRIVVDDPIVTSGWSYAALGHLHSPGRVNRLEHVRYAGSIDRLSMAEKDQRKGVVLISLHDAQHQVHTRLLPLPTTAFYDICINDPRRELPQLTGLYPDAATALVRCHIRFQPSNDNLDEILATVSRTFPRCYERTWSEKRARKPAHREPAPALVATDDLSAKPTSREVGLGVESINLSLTSAGSLHQLITDYLTDQVADASDRAEILKFAWQLIGESK